jgi:hypothetical protein
MATNDDESHTSSMNIHDFRAGRDVNIAGRDMFVGSDQGRENLAAIKIALASAALPPDVRDQAFSELRAAENEAAKADPDPATIRERIEALTRVLRDSGALISAGAALIDPLRELASGFGSAGATILNLIG